MSSQLAPLSASVTRILSLTGFPKELKTRDIQAAFSDWENSNGGFKIKWIDDTSLLIVFADAGVAKRAYLQALANRPPAIFGSSSHSSSAIIRPYDGPDAQVIIMNVNARHNSSASRSHNPRPSISMANGGGTIHGRASSSNLRQNLYLNSTIPEQPVDQSNSGAIYGREPSPTLPSLPAQPSLNSLISSSSSFGEDSILNENALTSSGSDEPINGAPRIGDPGKRMLGAALGMRHPGLGPRSLSGGGVTYSNGFSSSNADQALEKVQRAMHGLSVSSSD